jgi:hypothetical protein
MKNILILAVVLVCLFALLLAYLVEVFAVATSVVQARVTNGGTPVPHATGTPVVTGGSGKGKQIALNAELIASHLSGNPDVFYDQLPGDLTAFSQTICPPGSGCNVDWQSGSFQCVSLVVGAFHLSGFGTIPRNDAFGFWSTYAGLPGWQEIPNGSQLPHVGDMMVWADGAAGHIAIVVQVNVGAVLFAQANAPSPIGHEFMSASGFVSTSWPGYQIVGFIRALG